MADIACPACKNVELIHSVEAVYEAPFHCPKCLGLYFVRIENDVLTACEPLTESGYARWKMAQSGQNANG